VKPDLTPQILGREIGHALTGEVRVGLPGERLGAPQLRCGSTEARGGAVGTWPPAVVVLALRGRRSELLPADEALVTPPADGPATHFVSAVPLAEAWLFEGETRYPVAGASVRIGRKPDNDIVIPNDSVSSYHAEIIRRDGQYLIVDRGSSNKVFISGKPVHNVPLRDGDVIELGDVCLRFQLQHD